MPIAAKCWFRMLTGEKVARAAPPFTGWSIPIWLGESAIPCGNWRSTRETLGDSWYSAGDLFALHREGQIRLGSKQKVSAFRESLRARSRIRVFPTLLFDESRRRIIIVEQNNMAFIEGAHPDAGPQCVERRCEYHISPGMLTGHHRQQIRASCILHEYPYDGYGSRVAKTASTRYMFTPLKSW